MKGTKVKDQAASHSTEVCSSWKQQPIVGKPQSEFILGAAVEQKRVEGDLRYEKNLIIHGAPEIEATESADRTEDDLELIYEVCRSIDIDASKLKS